MPTYYVGSGGNDANSGTSWATRLLTLNAAEDVGVGKPAIAAGDTVYVGAGVYRETLTLDVSGVAGSPITYIGDYTGANTDGVGGVVRITGSDNDITATRNYCITDGGVQSNYRTFRGFQIDRSILAGIGTVATAGTNWIIENCAFQINGTYSIYVYGLAQSSWIIRRCCFLITGNSWAHIYFYHDVNVSNAGHTVENCIFIMNYTVGIQVARVGGITINGNLLLFGLYGVNVATVPAAGQIITITNSILQGQQTALRSASLGYLIEDYNAIFSYVTARSSVAIGVNSVLRPALFDMRVFFEMVNGGRMVTPFDLGQWSTLIDFAGLNPPTTDLRGTGQIGAARERGPLEYDTTLLQKGGAVSISPFRGNIG